MYNDVPTTCFGCFLSGHHQVGKQCQRNYTRTISIYISISVSTEKRGGVNEISFTNTGRVVRPVLEIRVLIVSALYVQLLFSCVGSRGLGLAALVSGGGRVS